MTELTLKKAIEIQQRDLSRWKSVLKPECFAKLDQWAKECTQAEYDPYSVVRGSTITEYVQNHLMANPSVE